MCLSLIVIDFLIDVPTIFIEFWSFGSLIFIDAPTMFIYLSLIFDQFSSSCHWCFIEFHLSSLECKTILRPFWALMSSAWPKIVGRRPGLCWRRNWRITKAFTFPAGAANLAFGVVFPGFNCFPIDFQLNSSWDLKETAIRQPRAVPSDFLLNLTGIQKKLETGLRQPRADSNWF